MIRQGHLSWDQVQRRAILRMAGELQKDRGPVREDTRDVPGSDTPRLHTHPMESNEIGSRNLFRYHSHSPVLCASLDPELGSHALES